jgi:hypothetical protein
MLIVVELTLCPWPETVASLVALFVLAVIVLVWTHDSNEYIQFQNLSQQFSGCVRRHWLRFGRHYVRFTRHDATFIVWIDYQEAESFATPHCHIEVRGFTPSILFEIIPRGLGSLVKRLLRYRRVTYKIPRISDQFDVFTDTPDQLPTLLSDSFKSDIQTLYAQGLNRISMSSSRFMGKRRLLSDATEADLDAWLGHSKRVAEKHYLQVADGHWERAGRVQFGGGVAGGAIRANLRESTPVLQQKIPGKTSLRGLGIPRDCVISTPARTRTLDPLIKSQLL